MENSISVIFYQIAINNILSYNILCDLYIMADIHSNWTIAKLFEEVSQTVFNIYFLIFVFFTVTVYFDNCIENLKKCFEMQVIPTFHNLYFSRNTTKA